MAVTSSALKKIIEMLYDFFVIGKAISENIQVSSDNRKAKRIREAIKQTNMTEALRDVRRIAIEDDVNLDIEDIIDVAPMVEGVVVSVDFIVWSRQVYRDLKRCRRKGK